MGCLYLSLMLSLQPSIREATAVSLETQEHSREMSVFITQLGLMHLSACLKPIDRSVVPQRNSQAFLCWSQSRSHTGTRLACVIQIITVPCPIAGSCVTRRVIKSVNTMPPHFWQNEKSLTNCFAFHDSMRLLWCIADTVQTCSTENHITSMLSDSLPLCM